MLSCEGWGTAVYSQYVERCLSVQVVDLPPRAADAVGRGLLTTHQAPARF